MSTREKAFFIFNSLSEEQLAAFVTLFGGTTTEEKVLAASDEEVEAISSKLMSQNIEAYRELAK